MSTVPFCYLVGWSKLNLWYYGVKYRVGCQPSDLWTKYFTSSAHVKETRKIHGEPDVIQVRKTFPWHYPARRWEVKVLRRINAKTNSKWLNQNDKMAPPSGPCSSGRRKNIAEARLNTPKKLCNFCGKSCDGGNYAQYHGEKCKENPNIDQMVLTLRSELCRKSYWKHPEHSVQNNMQRQGRDSHAQNSIHHICPHCAKEGNGPVMLQHHFRNCKVLTGFSSSKMKRDLKSGRIIPKNPKCFEPQDRSSSRGVLEFLS